MAFGEGITAMKPGAQQGVMMVVDDVDEQPWGRFVSFSDPDGNSWTLQQLPARS